MAKMNVKKGDNVVVLSGKDKGKQGEILRALPSEGRVIVEGVAIVKKAQRPPHKPAGRHHRAGGGHRRLNVMLVCPSCGKPSRVGHARDAEGKKVRVCKKCGAQF